jgi:hypothetical protein
MCCAWQLREDRLACSRLSRLSCAPDGRRVRLCRRLHRGCRTPAHIGRQETYRNRPIGDSDAHGPQLLSGYGFSVWRHNVALIQASHSEDSAAFPSEPDWAPQPVTAGTSAPHLDSPNYVLPDTAEHDGRALRRLLSEPRYRRGPSPSLSTQKMTSICGSSDRSRTPWVWTATHPAGPLSEIVDRHED